MILTRKLAKTNKRYVVFATISLQITCKSEAMEETQNLQLKFSSQLHSFLKQVSNERCPSLHFTTEDVLRRISSLDTCMHLSVFLSWVACDISSWFPFLFLWPPPPLLLASVILVTFVHSNLSVYDLCIISEIPLPQVILVIYFCNIYVFFPLKTSSNCSGCSKFLTSEIQCVSLRLYLSWFIC